jgi:RNA polymerase sigma-70 factor (ECF subfamily)
MPDAPDRDELARRWALVASHRERLLRIVRSRTTTAADAEDVVHETLVRAVLFETLDENRVGPFLTTVAIRLCADAHRSNGRADRLRERLTRHVVDEESPEEAVCDAAEARAVAAVYETLPERQRAVVAARSEGISCGQVARRLGLTYGAVESALTRARAAVRARADVCLEVTTLCASRVARTMRAVPAELPAASAVALGGLVATVLAAAPPARPAPVPVAMPLRPVVTRVAPPPRAVAPPAPRPRAVLAVPVRPVVRPPADLPAASRKPRSVGAGPARLRENDRGWSTRQEIEHCLRHGLQLSLPIRCGEPSESPQDTTGVTS